MAFDFNFDFNFVFVQLNEYYESKRAEEKRIQAEDQKKLENLMQELAKQADMDLERVEYRRAVHLERKLAEEKRKKDEQREMEEKEKKIERFLESVKPDVAASNARLMSFTKVYPPGNMDLVICRLIKRNLFISRLNLHEEVSKCKEIPIQMKPKLSQSMIILLISDKPCTTCTAIQIVNSTVMLD